MSCKEIGSGSYGVVFRPPLGSNDSTMVGKVIYPVDYKEVKREWFNVKAIKRIDPEQNYFLYPIKKENVDVTEYNKYAKKPFESTHTKNLTQFTIKDGGLSLRKYQCRSFSQVLTYVLQVAQSIQVMLQNNIVHLDIHLGNIMSNGIDSCKIIDFGLSKTSRTFYSHLNVLWSVEYAVNPPEFRLIQSKHKEIHNVIAEKEALAYYVSNDSSCLDYVYMNPEFIESFNDLHTSIMSLSDTGRPTKKVVLEYLKSINSHKTTDVYGLGVAMIDILTKTDYPEVSVDNYVKVWDIITNMIMPHPNDRMSIENVIIEIQCLLQKLGS
jgi:serine/threonine protein kinase